MCCVILDLELYSISIGTTYSIRSLKLFINKETEVRVAMEPKCTRLD